jgi:hypothetical protein
MTSRTFTLTEITATFVPFGLMLVAALIGAEAANNVQDQRLIYSIWVTIALMTPALGLYILPTRTEQRMNYWLLLWTFAFLAYLVHFYYAVVVHYHGSVAEVFEKQGTRIAGSNFLVTAWWGFDVVLAWVVAAPPKWIRIERGLAHGFIPFTFFVASVVIFRGFVNVLGIAMTATVAVSLIVRLHAWWVARAAAAVEAVDIRSREVT